MSEQAFILSYLKDCLAKLWYLVKI